LHQTWIELFRDGFQTEVTNAFVQCGMLNAIDRSEEHLIKVPGVENYSTGETDDEEESEQDTSDENESSESEMSDSSSSSG